MGVRTEDNDVVRVLDVQCPSGSSRPGRRILVLRVSNERCRGGRVRLEVGLIQALCVNNLMVSAQGLSTHRLRLDQTQVVVGGT